MSSTSQASYTFDDSDDEAIMSALPVLAAAAHTAYNNTSPLHHCFGNHSGGTGHRTSSNPYSDRCPAHGVMLAHINAEETDEGTWDEIRQELLRGQSWIPNTPSDTEGEIQRHLRLVAEVAALRAGDASRPDYVGIPQIGDFVVIVQIPQLLQPGELTAVLGEDGEVQPTPIPILNPEPEPWQGPVTAMVLSL